MSVPVVAVEATAPEYVVLRHPGGEALDAAGRGRWPDDSFTARRVLDGALRVVADDPQSAPPEGSSADHAERDRPKHRRA